MERAAGSPDPEDGRLLTVVVPTLNAARVLRRNISHFASLGERVIISDGGSTDETHSLARAAHVDLIVGDKGRGGQLARGAAAVSDGWLLFLHADTILADGARDAIHQFVQNSEYLNHVGYFKFALDQQHERAARLERRVAWRCRTFALPYGDQGLLIHRDLYQRVGGFKSIPLMEDVDLIWRLHKIVGKSAIIPLDAEAITSAEKFERGGYFSRSARNLFCLFLFRIGLSPHWIVKLYQ